jgi:hypothetical protein
MGFFQQSRYILGDALLKKCKDLQSIVWGLWLTCALSTNSHWQWNC